MKGIFTLGFAQGDMKFGFDTTVDSLFRAMTILTLS